MDLNQYIETVNKRFQSGISSEHSYRADLEALIRELVPSVDITNEPSKVTDCGSPDYVITQKEIPIGFIEAKDIGKDLNSSQYKEQFSRYRKALDNLIITDYLWFLFYQNNVLVAEIRIGEINIDGTSVRPTPENFDEFTSLIKEFCTFISQTIKSPKKLAEMMAAKARLLETILEKVITSDEESEENTALREQYETFKNILIHDLTPQGFADIYAQTLAYGMFAARLHDKTLEDFSRQEAAELIPKTNPFLRKLFNHVAGVDIDERIKTTVDNLAVVFRATNVEELLKNFGKSTKTHDPIIHFYETFLAEYDSKLRKSRGVYYTPEPVVNFIVRGVNDLLITEFNLKDGLADTSKITIQLDVPVVKGRGKTKGTRLEKMNKEVHKVQVLDPATGTGTFLAEVVKEIYNNKFKEMKGAWSSYVDEHLIPRLNGFEILMASYSMAHLKLDMLLSESGYKQNKNQRFNIYLTNALEEHHPDTGTLFSSWLSNEANEANHIKRDTPVMVVLGNPPYSVSSSNKGKWIHNLLKDYKKDLNERNIQPLSDDYIKFIRYGQHLIDKNGEGILAYISNNSFIDGIIHRQMRKSLLESFDKIYILDLHGNSNKKEVTPEGNKDENVFDIRQGVSISLFIKSKKKASNKTMKIFHYDLYGKRDEKYNFLNVKQLSTINWNEIPEVHPEWLFVKQDLNILDNYKDGFSINDIFEIKSTGIKSHRDNLVIDIDKSILSERINLFLSEDIEDEKIRTTLNLKDNRDWNLSESRNKNQFDKGKIRPIQYRPLDNRFVYYDPRLIDFPRDHVMSHMFSDNLALIIPKQVSEREESGAIITKVIAIHKSYSAYNTNYYFPLYVYKNDLLINEKDNSHNFNLNEIETIERKLHLKFSTDNSISKERFTPLDLIDYIYAILHSPKYRKKYKEFLKSDFPRIPYPVDQGTFWALGKLGGELRKIHLLESDVLENYITSYPEDGDNVITRKINKKDWELYNTKDQLGRIWINDQQYFEKIPFTAWEFYLGGYQPAQKWLKDRSGRKLSVDDIFNYQKIIVALVETDRIMQEINNVDLDR